VHTGLIDNILDSNASNEFNNDMTTLTIRKLDDEIKGHSMEQEARLILKNSLQEAIPNRENGSIGIKRWRGRWKNRLSSEDILNMTRKA
jgi:plasmid stability protein